MNSMRKRIFDVLASLFSLILLAPVLLIIAIAIKLDSPGKVFFIQSRVGKHGILFKIIKFRTMVDRDPGKIDQFNEEVISKGRDPRITRVGRLLRATSLDELPQLFNILFGNMSIVGPRPIIPEQKPFIPPGYLHRFEVAPGLTGLAQVSGRRSLGWLEQLAYDLKYVQERSFWLDVKIITQTAWMVLARKGVYGNPGMNWRTYAAFLDGREPRDQDVLDFVDSKNREA